MHNNIYDFLLNSLVDKRSNMFSHYIKHALLLTFALPLWTLMSWSCLPLGQTCQDKLCWITQKKTCQTDADCCCRQRCSFGCCLPKNAEGQATGICPQPDGGTNERQTCITGQTRVCYPNPQQPIRGLCRNGVQHCLDDGSWGACEGYIQPQDEECNGHDDDCNGNIDDGLKDCTCQPGITQACKGVCGEGTQTCGEDQKWQPCRLELTIKAEECNGKDDDCDGLIDEEFKEQRQECSISEGCTGVYICRNASLACQSTTNQPESCNGKDDNCDGSIDNTETLCAPEIAWKTNKNNLQRIERVHLANKATTVQYTIKNNDPATTLAYRPDRKQLASGQRSGTIYLWHMSQTSSATTLSAHKNDIVRLLYANNSQRLLSLDNTGMFVLWDVTKGEQLTTGQHTRTSENDVAIAPDGLHFYVLNRGLLEVWDDKGGKKQQNLRDNAQGIAIDASGLYIGILNTSQTVSFFDTASYNQQAKADVNCIPTAIWGVQQKDTFFVICPTQVVRIQLTKEDNKLNTSNTSWRLDRIGESYFGISYDGKRLGLLQKNQNELHVFTLDTPSTLRPSDATKIGNTQVFALSP